MDKLSPTDSLGSLVTAPIGPYQPDLRFETRLIDYGRKVVAGIDEAGRGPLAGPVVAAAVILDMNNVPAELNDSKKLSHKQRIVIFDDILENCQVAAATIGAGTIDIINIRQATLRCMENAARALATKSDWHLIDGRDVPPELSGKATAVIKGDGRSMSIAAASIVAKVIRDAIMTQAANSYPVYGFEKHKGYGTKDHIRAISQHGPCPLHRFSFAPISNK